MRRSLLVLAAVLAASALIGAAPAQADFGLKDLDVAFTNTDGSVATQAGSHPYAMTTTIDVNTTIDPKFGEIPVGSTRDLKIETPPGLVAAPIATPRCSLVEFWTLVNGPNGGTLSACPNSTAVGVATVRAGFSKPGSSDVPVFNLIPPPHAAASFGFIVLGVRIVVEVGIKESPPYNGVVEAFHIPQALRFYGNKLTVWGNPADPVHDPYRGTCLNEEDGNPEAITSVGICPANASNRPFLTLPRSCSGPLTTTFEADSWQNPAIPFPFKESVLTHDGAEPIGMTGCSILGFTPKISAQPTNTSAESPTGLDFDLDIKDEGMKNPDGVAQSDIKKTVVTLPEGVTINPSQAEGLAVCTEAELEKETALSEPGEGCPEASKIGTAEAESPLVDESLEGSLFVAKPYENPFGSLIAVYMTLRNPNLGVIVKLAGKVEPDPQTGQLISTFDDLPQLPASHFHLHFREGGRSPLVTPPLCGDYTTEAELTPWANPSNVTSVTSTFHVTGGPNGGPCPASGTPPFSPGFSAGSVSNNAATYSPFYMRLTRRDGDQDLTRFSATLPPGMVAKLAGVSQCSTAQIAQARAKTGKQEQAQPSCSASSEIGHVIGGAGVGSQLTYVPGKIYLAGPLNGAPLSVVAIVPAVAGPFDVGNVVVQEALRLNPRTGVVRADGSASDPLPHILAGIPLKVRDVRVYVDRPNFTLNPTNCDPFSVGAELWGGGSNVFSSADDSPISLAQRFQAANCARLGFKPRLSLRLKGGTKRGDHPKLHSVYTPRSSDANLSDLVVRLPRSAFLDQAHIRTICTRVQFAADNCPAGAIYGQAKAFTPLLDQPLQGPVYLRSSNHNLPDFVADLHGLVDFEVVGRIDSQNGGIRTTFEDLPDAPVSKVIVDLPGAKRGLIVNSTNLCLGPHRALIEATGQNGRQDNFRPNVQASCAKASGRKRR
jgi:hypothetical protein